MVYSKFLWFLGSNCMMEVHFDQKQELTLDLFQVLCYDITLEVIVNFAFFG